MGQHSDDDLAFHFHFSRKLFDISRSLHFHLHLEEGFEQKDPGAKQPPAGAGPGLPFKSKQVRAESVTSLIQHPQDGAIVDVRLTDGAICAYGQCPTLNENMPNEVWAAILPGPHCDPLSPSHPSTPAGVVQGTLVNFDAHPLFSHEPTATYAFATDTQITGVQHDGGGTASNCLAIWFRWGSTWSDAFTRQFFGRTADATECDGPVPSPSSLVIASKSAFRQASRYPATLKLSLDSTAKHLHLPGLDGPLGKYLPETSISLELNRGLLAHCIPTWETKGCSKHYGAWQLRRTQLGNNATGMLILSQIGGQPLSPPLVWKAISWQPEQRTQFTPDKPKLLTDANVGCGVAPA